MFKFQPVTRTSTPIIDGPMGQNMGQNIIAYTNCVGIITSHVNVSINRGIIKEKNMAHYLATMLAVLEGIFTVHRGILGMPLKKHNHCVATKNDYILSIPSAEDR